jgi:group I intron endonuclease
LIKNKDLLEFQRVGTVLETPPDPDHPMRKHRMAESGIYEIVNLVNGNRYVGSAANFRIRWRQHRRLLNRGEHYSPALQRAWLKHGQENFEFRAILECERARLIAEEQSELDRQWPEYNNCPTAGSSLGRVLSPETKAKIGDRLRGRKRDPEVVAGVANKLRGRKRPPEIAAKLMGNRHAVGSRHTDEWKAANSARLKDQYASGERSRARPPEYRAKIAATLTGRKATPEHRANQSAAQRGKKRGPYKLRA